LGRGLETPEGLFLEAVGDRPNQKGPAKTAGGLLTVEVLPALAELRDTSLLKARNFLSERCSVGRQLPPLGVTCRDLMNLKAHVWPSFGQTIPPPQ
jgi:hypothetical protein